MPSITVTLFFAFRNSYHTGIIMHFLASNSRAQWVAGAAASPRAVPTQTASSSSFPRIREAIASWPREETASSVAGTLGGAATPPHSGNREGCTNLHSVMLVQYSRSYCYTGCECNCNFQMETLINRHMGWLKCKNLEPLLIFCN